ncbi:MAG: SH3 domain-containing protein [Balneolaceae bacterium]
MKRQFSIIIILLVLQLVIGSCTSSRWIITDEFVIDPNDEPELVSERSILMLDRLPTFERPQATFRVFRLTERQYQQRIKMERSVQQYRPRWGFFITGLAASAYTFVAANSSGISPSVSSSQRTVMNISAGVLAAVSILNMKPVGEPIFTGESQLMRESGFITLTDTTDSFGSQLTNVQLADVNITFRGDTLISESNLAINNGTLEINLGSINQNIETSEIDDESQITINLNYSDQIESYDLRLTSFLLPHVSVTSPIALLRNAPVINNQNIITEIGQGSSLRIIEEENEWYRVQFGGSEVYVRKSNGIKVWRSDDLSGSMDVYEFEEVPFGEIDVENSVPILKSNNPLDRAIILTNGFTGHTEPRQYLDRDHDLIKFYLSSALQLAQDQILYVEMDSLNDWRSTLNQFATQDSTSSLFVYLSGYAHQSQSNEIRLSQVDNDEEPTIMTHYLLDVFEQMNPDAFYLFTDLEFVQNETNNGWIGGRNSSIQVLMQTANEILRRMPNSALIYSNRPGQGSSVYAAAGLENRRHHIFNYYLADAIKKRNVRVADIVRHLENNVDYTSRRYHDRPQDVIVFGNTTLQINQ